MDVVRENMQMVGEEDRDEHAEGRARWRGGGFAVANPKRAG